METIQTGFIYPVAEVVFRDIMIDQRRDIVEFDQ